MNSTSILKPKNQLTREPFNHYDKDEFYYIDELSYIPNNGIEFKYPNFIIIMFCKIIFFCKRDLG